MLFTTLDRFRDAGLLLLRLGLGTAFLFHGWPKLAGGPERWIRLSASVGIDFLPAFFGFMAGLAEFGGGILLALGLLFRPAAFFMGVTMAFATYRHIAAGEGFLGGFAHPLEMGIVFFALLLIGPGRFSLDHRLGAGRRRGF